MLDLFSKRQRRGQADETEAYRYDALPRPLKVQVLHIWRELLCKFPSVCRSLGAISGVELFFLRVRDALCKEYGEFHLTSGSKTAEQDVCDFFLQHQDVAKCLDVIETVFARITEVVVADSYVNFDGRNHIRHAVEELNRRFQEHTVGYEFREGRMIRIDSAFLHNQVVTPTMALLGEPHLSGANQEFLKAHEHYRHGRLGESINECLKAFESTMKAICHKRRWPYSQNDTAKALLTACEKNGLFPAFVSSSLSGLRSVLENVATIRNKLSGHGQGVQPIQITDEVAAFVLHSTGANILLMASLEKRLK